LSRRVFITGVTGFVGRYLQAELESGDCVVFGTAFPEAPEPPPDGGSVRVTRLDIRSEKELTAAIAEVDPDWVVHLAALSHVKLSWEKRRDTLETNLIGTLNLLEAVRKQAPGARFLFVSSSDVYGRGTAEQPLREDDPVLSMNPYALTKLGGEKLVDFYRRIEKLDAVIARSFPHTGPGQSADFVCSDWAFQLASIEKGLREPVIRVGNLDVSRDFLDVRDVVKAYAALLRRGRKGEIYNVSSGRATALRDILDRLLSGIPVDIKVEIDPAKLRKTDIALLSGDNRKIRQETHWNPVIPFEETLQDLLDDWRIRLSA